jgi:multisubunit Na+/H+ antiporter MnhG subunit
VTHTRHVLSDVVVVAGTGLDLLAVLGLIVMRDALDRLHFVGVAGFGALLIGGAVMLRSGLSLLGNKALATGLLLALLGPVLMHVTARSLRIRARGDWRPSDGEDAER